MREVNGLKVYGPRPDPGAMLARCAREGLDAGSYKLCLWKRRKAYYVEAYAFPAGTRSAVARPAPGAGVVLVDIPVYWVYALRGDGKIERSWVTVDESDLVFEPKEE